MPNKQILGLKMAKNPVLGQQYFFFSKIWLHQSLHIMVSYHHLQYQKKLMTQSWQNLVTNGQMDRQRVQRDLIEPVQLRSSNQKLVKLRTKCHILVLYWLKLLQLRTKFLMILNILILKNLVRAENFAARLKHADLENKTDFDNKLKSFNR